MYLHSSLVVYSVFYRCSTRCQWAGTLIHHVSSFLHSLCVRSQKNFDPHMQDEGLEAAPILHQGIISAVLQPLLSLSSYKLRDRTINLALYWLWSSYKCRLLRCYSIKCIPLTECFRYGSTAIDEAQSWRGIFWLCYITDSWYQSWCCPNEFVRFIR